MFISPKAAAEVLRRRAAAAGLPLSRYIAKVVLGEHKCGWPPGYFEKTVGSWDGDVVESTELPLEPRISFKEPPTTDSLRHGGMGEFLARSSRACAACALLRNHSLRGLYSAT